MLIPPVVVEVVLVVPEEDIRVVIVVVMVVLVCKMITELDRINSTLLVVEDVDLAKLQDLLGAVA